MDIPGYQAPLADWRDATPGDYAVIGDPVAHSYSPRLHTWAYRDAGHSLTYRAIHVPEGEAAAALDHLVKLGYRGVNVTVPHKAAALAWAEEATDEAQAIGAANTLDLTRKRAHNTDAEGMWRSLPYEPERALVLGAGGAARAAVDALRQHGVATSVWARRPEAAETLAHDFDAEAVASLNPAGYDLVINATSAGLLGSLPPLLLDDLDAHCLDLAYGRAARAFLTHVRPKVGGARVQDGTRMLIHQAALAFAWWGLGEQALGPMIAAVEPVGPRGDAFDASIRALKRGEFVVMPTETVLGLAADARNPEAIRRIYAAKGRPETNPLIVHIGHREMVHQVVSEWPPMAQALAERFWPGPLTIVLPKHNQIPDETTAGLDTVGVRWPYHPMAQAVLEAFDAPLAAPSANPYQALSPTHPAHLDPAIQEGAFATFAGAATDVGIESTVVRVEGRKVTLLRPGAISREAIAALAGTVHDPEPDQVLRAPGHAARHYAPKMEVILVDRPGPGELTITLQPSDDPQHICLGDDPGAYAQALYGLLAQIERTGAEWVAVERPPESPSWEAIHDRLRRMTG